jgi:hypothetical protein
MRVTQEMLVVVLVQRVQMDFIKLLQALQRVLHVLVILQQEVQLEAHLKLLVAAVQDMKEMLVLEHVQVVY